MKALYKVIKSLLRHLCARNCSHTGIRHGPCPRGAHSLVRKTDGEPIPQRCGEYGRQCLEWGAIVPPTPHSKVQAGWEKVSRKLGILSLTFPVTADFSHSVLTSQEDKRRDKDEKNTGAVLKNPGRIYTTVFYFPKPQTSAAEAGDTGECWKTMAWASPVQWWEQEVMGRGST